MVLNKKKVRHITRFIVYQFYKLITHYYIFLKSEHIFGDTFGVTFKGVSNRRGDK